MRTSRWRAQALIWITMMLPVFLSIVGLALDGGIVLVRHRQLQSVADGAARAAATRLDLDRLRSSGGVDVQLDQALAHDVALTYVVGVLQVERTWVDSVTANVGVSSRRVEVTVQATTRTAFLRIAHIDSVPLTVDAEAEVQFGIHDGQGG